MKFKSICTTTTLSLLGAFIVCSAPAQTPPARVVNRDELRACMSSTRKLTADRQSLSERGTKAREEARAIAAELQELTEQRPRAEERGGVALDRFNRKVKSHNARMEAVRASAERIGKDEQAFNAETIAYNASCGRISFKPEDKEAILKELAPADK
jgi:hypothetical protein